MDFDSFVLAAATHDLADEPAARETADIVEFRMDLASDPLDALDAYDGELPLLVTNRPTWEGGDAPATPVRLETLERALGHDAVVAVDVEYAALSGAADEDATHLQAAASDQGVAVVVSMHDFEATPDRATIEDKLRAASEYGDVAKLATTAKNRGDVLALLGATHALTAAGHTVATMAMGEAGRHSRAVAPLYGSRIGYAPVDPAHATAPGQFDLATLRDLVDRLESDDAAV
jgi:3-dehydroquinate dehydratase-1